MYLSASLFDLDDPGEVPDVGLELQKLVPHFHRILGGEASRRQNSLKQNPEITGYSSVAKQQYWKCF
jgi:hypothetical protein